ncbi:6-carboxytetrahydropterin synthase [Polaromonas sp. CG_9.11]|uniref:6-carboxytetrahydropterin synthase n=1 Tax=Polaromonas sp. CG_9.11 TaxID=2787730 RepID=UPI0018C8E3BE|nr:6-carboxytetrahydropterin synthase [Polaromonas sp. CG_9.11]
MVCEISQSFFFDAAHTLDRAIETAASRRIHGHTYNAEVFLTGQPDPATGMVTDLGLVRRELALLREQLDHHLLDEVPGLGPTTLENLCQFIFSKLLPALPTVTSVRVWRVSIGDGCRVTRPL